MITGVTSHVLQVDGVAHVISDDRHDVLRTGPARPAPVRGKRPAGQGTSGCGGAGQPELIRRQRIRPQTMAESPLIVSMPYCSVGFPVVSTAIR